jgi:hypothetical protein
MIMKNGNNYLKSPLSTSGGSYVARVEDPLKRLRIQLETLMQKAPLSPARFPCGHQAFPTSALDSRPDRSKVIGMEIEARIREALLEWNRALAPGSGEQLVACLQRLDALRREGGASLHPQLGHFLERRSYQKALAWLETTTASGS